MDRPTALFDRDREWAALVRFAADRGPGASLGLVTGRRRQGKSTLLRALVDAAGGFYYHAIEGVRGEQLAGLGAAIAADMGAPAPLAIGDWDDALRAIASLAARGSTVIVLDELPYLVAADRSLPSRLQAALAPGGALGSAPVRLLVCGSAIATMGRLLAGSAPLRGRSSLELVVAPFDHRTAARFWNLGHDPVAAVLTFAVVGGTPAYAREFVRSDTPRGSDDFDAWVCRTVLDPSSPLFREARYLLADDPSLAETRDRALYHAVLGAVVSGRTTRGGIASYLARPSTDIAHPLNVLVDAGLLRRREDPLRKARPVFEAAEPLLRFYHAVMRPSWAALERGGLAEQVWQASAGTFRAQVLGPTFEELSRAWVLEQGLADAIGPVAVVGSTEVRDARERAVLQLDVVALDDRGIVRLLGEAKVGEVMGQRHLARLRRARSLLAAAGHDVSAAQLACFSVAGFTADLQSEAARGAVRLVDCPMLYR